MAAPVIGQAASLHRNATTRAMASGGTALRMTCSGYEARLASVSMIAGTIAFTRMPCSLDSAARICVSRTTAVLDTAYAALPAPPSMAGRAATLTIEPPVSRIARAAYRHDSQVDVRLSSI